MQYRNIYVECLHVTCYCSSSITMDIQPGVLRRSTHFTIPLFVVGAQIRSVLGKHPWVLKHSSRFWPVWVLTRDIYHSCYMYIDPLKFGTWVLSQEWALAWNTIMVHVCMDWVLMNPPLLMLSYAPALLCFVVEFL